MHRFTREDPIGFYAGPNFYTYVSNRVTHFNDPWGLDPLQRSRFGFSAGYTWGTEGKQCTLGEGCKPTTTFPPAFQFTLFQISYNQPAPNLNPLNVNVNIYSHNPTSSLLTNSCVRRVSVSTGLAASYDSEFPFG